MHDRTYTLMNILRTFIIYCELDTQIMCMLLTWQKVPSKAWYKSTASWQCFPIHLISRRRNWWALSNRRAGHISSQSCIGWTANSDLSEDENSSTFCDWSDKCTDVSGQDRAPNVYQTTYHLNILHNNIHFFISGMYL